jgi:hypothetical protein
MARLAADGTSALRPLHAAPQPPSSAPEVVSTPESASSTAEAAQEGPKTGRGSRGRKRKQNAEEAK